MRRNMIMLLAAALLVVTGCKKDDKTTEGEKMTFSAGFDNGSAKTEINGLDMSWNEGDAVMINGKVFTADQSGRNTTLSGEKTYQEGGLYKAYFPASMYDNGTLTLPATQTYNGKNLSGVNPMYAQSENTNLTFSNLCAMVKLQLTGSKTVKEIRVSADQPLSGEFEIAESGSNYKAVMKSQTGNAGVTLNCGAGVDLSTSNVFYVALPEGDYTNLKFFVVTTDNMCTSIDIVSATLVANNIHDLVRTPEFQEAVTPVEVTIALEGCLDYMNHSVSGTVTVPSGEHVCEFGVIFSETDETPTIEEGASKIIVHTFSDNAISGTVNYYADFGVLADDETYYVRSYAMCDGLLYSSESTIKTIVGGKVPLPLPSTWTGGKNPHPFTVGEGKVVYFSQGNLQYIGSAESPYWKFANHQFDLLGVSTGQNSTDPKVDRDLFGWGTSGINHGANAYCPWNATRVDKNYYAYGDVTKNLCDDPGTADWGYNAINNGGNMQNSGWRTLTAEEGKAMVARKDKNGNVLNGEGKIGNCTPGLIILPDDWDWNKISLSEFASTWVPGSTSFANNNYSYSDWAKMEAAGAVFLPAAGNRDGTEVEQVGTHGYYWSSTCYSSQSSYNLWFYETVVDQNDTSHRRGYFSVRLVRDN
ncbi:MAG: hypothetical protein KBT57_07995 [bacterium]|nr:hypothetical protein [Candidatus Limimorpha equi]